MRINPTQWRRAHDAIAKQRLKRHGIANSASLLPTLPKEPLEWIEAARPVVEGRRRSFLSAPFWVPIYNDPHSFIQIIGGRQIYKSTACTDFIAMEATANSGVQVCYVSFDETNLKSFSKQKLQVGTFEQNSVLSQFPRNRLGSIHEISLKNGSTIYLTTDADQYKHVEGKSLNLCLLDEAQYQDIQHLNRVHQTMMATKGKIKILGIGGEAGSPYEKLWRSTNQMEWHYEYPDWRNKLQFNQEGLVVDEYLKDVLRGSWIAQNPDAKEYHGYHLPQHIFPTIPLTKLEATEKYNLHARFSIEYQKETMTASDYVTHVYGLFYTSSRRPITRQMVESCMKPYRYLSLLLPHEVIQLKNTFSSEIKVTMGVDFGSGKSSQTVIAILIYWKKSNRIQLAWIERRPSENQLEQAQYITELFQRYDCDIGVGDLGYAANQIKLIQDGGFDNNTGQRYQGVSDSKFFGCRSVSDETKPIQSFNTTIDEHGEQTGRLQLDKTSGIELLIESLERSLYHPRYPENSKFSRQRLMIPSQDPAVEFLVDDLTSITRKDLELVMDKTKEDGRQRARKEFNHPPDSAMALIYGLVAIRHDPVLHWFSV